jgi:hypothetical protein
MIEALRSNVAIESIHAWTQGRIETFAVLDMPADREEELSVAAR